MRGRFVSLSPARKFIIDLTGFPVPSVPVQRVMNLAAVVEARAAAKGRPAWSAIFAKAYALVADEVPQLRRAYIKLPSPRLYEYPRSTVSVAVEREYEGEMIVLTNLIRDPSHLPLDRLSDAVRAAQTEPLENEKNFRLMVRLARLPAALRRAIWWLGLNIGRQRANHFGTFGLTVYSSLGAESLHPISPLTALVNYGVIADDGNVAVRIMYDHRVLDGAMVARVLEKMEQKLTTDIVAELKALK